MVQRITRGMLDRKIKALNKDYGLHLKVGYATNVSARLESDDGTQSYSYHMASRGTKKDVYDQLDAISGVLYFKTVSKIPYWKNKTKDRRFTKGSADKRFRI